MKTIVNQLLLLILTVFWIVGCSADVEVGGSCDYQRLEDPAIVRTVTESRVILDGVEVYDVPISDFAEMPTAGEEYIVNALHIIQGSCNPISVHGVKKR